MLDLTDPSVLKLLGTNEQEMTGIWSGVGSPPTHRLGEVVFQTGAFAGMSYGSARYPAGNNLVVFAERLSPQSTDYLEVFDPYGDLKQRIP